MTEIILREDSTSVEVKRYLMITTKSKFRGDEEIGENQNLKLGEIIKKIYLLVEAGKAFSNEADKSIDEVAELRSPYAESNEGNDLPARLQNFFSKGRNDAYKDKIKNDYKTFLKARERAIENIEKTKSTRKPLEDISLLEDDEFWGSRQQLRSGKVVSDMLGGMDPVFGVLLNPTGGRIGPGDSEGIHEVFYKEDTPLAYHAAVHDAFGYLIHYHGVGPGYNYLSTRWTLFRTESPLSGHTAGIKFWKTVFKRNPVEKEF